MLMWRAGTKTEAKRWDAEEDLLHSIANIYEVTTEPRYDRSRKWQASVRQVARLNQPLRLEALRADRILRDTPWMRASLQGRWDLTPYWWRFYELILRLNPELKRNRRFLRASAEVV